MTHEELVGKFERNAQELLDAQQRRRLIDAVMNLERTRRTRVYWWILSIAEGAA